MCPLYSRHVSALILVHHIRAETCREYKRHIIKYFVNCFETQGIIIYSRIFSFFIFSGLTKIISKAVI
jgi:hypothetical protein